MDLKMIRRSKNLTLQALANISGVSLRTIQDIEARGDCRVSTARTLAKAMEISLDELCQEKVEK